jgi:DNA-binding XRE family transcriptional regulator
MRLALGFNQKELAAIAEIHLQSLGKIERGMTTKLSSHSKSRLASALPDISHESYMILQENAESLGKYVSARRVELRFFCINSKNS